MTAFQRPVFRREQAKKDLIELHVFLFEENERIAETFLVEVRNAFDLIARMPNIGRSWNSPHPSLKEIRVLTVSRRFRDYLIFYRPLKDRIEIITVLHGARDLPDLIESSSRQSN